MSKKSAKSKKKWAKKQKWVKNPLVQFKININQPNCFNSTKFHFHLGPGKNNLACVNCTLSTFHVPILFLYPSMEIVHLGKNWRRSSEQGTVMKCEVWNVKLTWICKFRCGGVSFLFFVAFLCCSGHFALEAAVFREMDNAIEVVQKQVM